MGWENMAKVKLLGIVIQLKSSHIYIYDLSTETVEVSMVKTTDRREQVTFQNCQFQEAVEKKEMKVSKMCLFVNSCGSKDTKIPFRCAVFKNM